MPRIYAALNRRCWGVQPDDMCRNCSYFFFDNLPAGLVPGYWSPLGAEAMQRARKWLHDQLPCDLERVDAAEAAEADDKELPGIERGGVHHGVIGASERISAAAACPAAAAAATGGGWGASRSTRASTAAVTDALGARQSICTQAYVPAEEPRASGFRKGKFAAADDDDDDGGDSAGGGSCADHSGPSWDKADLALDDGTTTPMPTCANVAAAVARSSRLSAQDCLQAADFGNFPWLNGSPPSPGIGSVGLQLALAEHLTLLKPKTKTCTIFSSGSFAVQKTLRRLQLGGDSAKKALQRFKDGVTGARAAVDAAISKLRLTLQLKPSETLCVELIWFLHREQVENTPGAEPGCVLPTEQLVTKSWMTRQRNYHARVQAEFDALAQQAKVKLPLLDLADLAKTIRGDCV